MRAALGERILNIAVLVSGSGRTLQNFIDLINAGQLPARIALVIGSKSGIGALDKAANAKLMNFVVERRDFPTVEAYSKRVFDLCDDAGIDLVCLAGWLCLLNIPDRYAGKVMNIHPALLPAYGGKGMYGHHVHEAVLADGCKVSGCTVHFVDNDYDAGPIILQRVCEVREDDTADTLAARVFDEESIAYPQAIRLFAQGRLSINGKRVIVRPSP